MARIVGQDLARYVETYSTKPSDLLVELEAETWANVEVPEALSGPIVGEFLRILVQLMGANRVLEIGTYVGYATLSIAEVLPDDGGIWTCEINSNLIAFAESYFRRSRHGDKIHVVHGNALETLKDLTPGFDLVFIDADKQNYPYYFEEAMRLSRPGGCIVVDNALSGGRVLNPDTSVARAIHQMNERIRGDDRVESVILTVRDGLQLIRRRPVGTP